MLSIAAGLLLALSWPAKGFPFLAFFAFIPLLFVEQEVLDRRKELRSIAFFLYAYTAFFVFNLLTTWWILFATIPGMVVAVVLNSLFMAIPWWLMHKSRRISGAARGPLALVVFWMAFEFLHARWELSWSWLDLGNVFAAYPAWIQWYEHTGVAGGTLWVLSINILVYLAISQTSAAFRVPKKARWNAAMAVVLFCVPAVYSFALWIGYEEDVRPVEIVVIQPSENPYEPIPTQADAEQRVEHMISLAEEKATSSTRFVVAPEGANPRGIWMHEDENHYAVRRIREHLEHFPDLTWVIGSFTYRLYRDREEAPATARPYGDTGRYFDAFNSAVMIEYGRPIQYYHKSKLVPGIERMPYFRILQPVGDIVERFGGIGGSLGTQEDRTAMATSWGMRIAPAVCYESIYGDFMAEYVKDNAGLLFIITNDGWWRDTPGYRQHLQYARLRAIETRRSIARSASTGISAFIGQRGEIIKQTPWWEPVSISTNLNQNHRITFFARTGNFLGKISVFVSALLLMAMVAQAIILRNRP